MNNSTENDRKISAGAAGIGGGTLFVLIANNLPTDSVIKPWLLLITPAVSISLSAVWLWLRVEIANYVQDLRIKSLAKAAKVAFENALLNPHTSEEHKSRIRERLEEVEILLTTRHLTRLKNVNPITVSDIIAFDKQTS